MLRNCIVLPNGTKLMSGQLETNVITRVSVKESCNAGVDLTLGSTCTSALDFSAIVPNGNLSLAQGDVLLLYRVDESNNETPAGVFNVDTSQRTGANTLQVTAYDNVSLLEKDLTIWLSELLNWPYKLYDFAKLVCIECGLTLATESLPNGDYLVQKFSANGITGRQLIQWVGEISGRFCRARADGSIEFAWYTKNNKVNIRTTPSDVKAIDYESETLSMQFNENSVVECPEDVVAISTSQIMKAEVSDETLTVLATLNDKEKALFYYQGGLKFENYQTALIEKVQIRQNPEDVGTVYPDVPGQLNTYFITGNYLLTASSATDLVGIAQVLYEQLSEVTYVPCNISTPLNLDVRVGDIIEVVDRNGARFSTYIMSKSQSGQKEVLECTGSTRRDSSSSTNNQTFQAYVGKVLNLQTSVDGLKATNADMQGQMASISLTLDNIETTVSQQVTQGNDWVTRLTAVEQTAQGLQVKVNTITENGEAKTVIGRGYSLTEQGFIINKEGESMYNRLDYDGMLIQRDKGTSNAEVILQANSKGVNAIDITVRNYFVIGHARFEKYTENRTACFYI